MQQPQNPEYAATMHPSFGGAPAGALQPQVVPNVGMGPTPQPAMPPQAGYSAFAPQLGYAPGYQAQAGPQMAMAYLPSVAGQAPAGFDATGKPLYAVMGAGPNGPAGAGAGYAPVVGFAEQQQAAAAAALRATKEAEEQVRGAARARRGVPPTHSRAKPPLPPFYAAPPPPARRRPS